MGRVSDWIVIAKGFWNELTSPLGELPLSAPTLRRRDAMTGLEEGIAMGGGSGGGTRITGDAIMREVQTTELTEAEMMAAVANASLQGGGEEDGGGGEGPTAGQAISVLASSLTPAALFASGNGLIDLGRGLHLRMRDGAELERIRLPCLLSEYQQAERVSGLQLLHAVQAECMRRNIMALEPAQLDALLVCGMAPQGSRAYGLPQDPALRSAGSFVVQGGGGATSECVVPILYRVQDADFEDSGTWGTPALISLRLGSLLNAAGNWTDATTGSGSRVVSPWEGVLHKRGWVLEFVMHNLSCNLEDCALELRLVGSAGAPLGPWSVWRKHDRPVLVNLPEAPENSVIMGSLAHVEEFDRRQSRWVPISPVVGAAPSSSSSSSLLLLPLESACRSLLVKSAYEPDEFALARCASWGLFVADRPRSYYEALARPLHGEQKHCVAVQRTPETLVLLSCVLFSLRRPTAPPEWQRLAAQLRAAWQDHGGTCYRMPRDVWRQVLDLAQPALPAEFLETVSIQVRRYDGAPFFSPQQQQNGRAHAPLVFSLEFRINYVDLSDCNARYWDPEAASATSFSSSASVATADLATFPFASAPPSSSSSSTSPPLPLPPPSSPVLETHEEFTQALRDVR